MFLMNHWYVAAWSNEITRTPLSRRLLGRLVCLYRRQDGTPVALDDRCPHRNLPLSCGKLIGDEIQCGYHGLRFAPDGKGTKVPGEETVPKWCRVDSFPLAERFGWTFIWLGDPALADEAKVPAFHTALDDPEWGYASGRLLVKCGYRMMLDNLLDLSHLAYVHDTTTGNADVGEAAKVLVTSNDDTHVRQVRIMRDVAAAPAFAFYGQYGTSRIDRWQCTNYFAPSYIHINNGSRFPQANDDFDVNNDLGHWGFRVYHALTPETDTSTHQFWAVPRRKDMVSDKHADLWQQQMDGVLEEDHVVYVHQQRYLADDPLATDNDVRPEGAIEADKGLYRARAIIRRLAQSEAARNSSRQAAK